MRVGGQSMYITVVVRAIVYGPSTGGSGVSRCGASLLIGILEWNIFIVQRVHQAAV